jgi:hypothetical protein
MRRLDNVKNNELSLIERSAAQRTCTCMKRKTANIATIKTAADSHDGCPPSFFPLSKRKGLRAIDDFTLKGKPRNGSIVKF